MKLRILLNLGDEDATIDVETALLAILRRVPAMVKREIDSMGEGDCYSANLFDRNGVHVGRALLHGDEYQLTADDNEV